MAEKPENPPAFPQMTPQALMDSHKGMTLRDYFAAAALQGLLANSVDPTGQQLGNMDIHDHQAKNAYEYADSMLDERKK